MTSLKAIANCLWAGADAGFVPKPPSPFSVVRNFFGYRVNGHTGSLSVKQQIELVRGRHIHLNVITVGDENFGTGHRQIIDQAIENMRGIYAAVGVGIGRVLAFSIPEADANESLIFKSIMVFDSLAESLTNDWTVHNNALDIFVVLQFDLVPGGVIGRSPVGGGCDKDDSCEMTGCVVSLETGGLTGQLLGHEVGHYLGLPHINGLSAQAVDMDNNGVIDPWVTTAQRANLMFPVNTGTSNTLTAAQVASIFMHCFWREGC